uniref:Peptidase S1 domain-containing protein n=1 Tax=Pseudonaja textilis TaxID=8673 RepID=A0A670ZMD6_PSETE
FWVRIQPIIFLCRRVCGGRPLAMSHGMLRIVGGVDSLPGTWPWAVSFQFPTRDGYRHFCAGSLINSRWVISTAQCFLIQKSGVVVVSQYQKWGPVSLGQVFSTLSNLKTCADSQLPASGSQPSWSPHFFNFPRLRTSCFRSCCSSWGILEAEVHMSSGCPG